jgi:hypothetical protein
MPLYSPPTETDPVAGAALTSHTANVTDAHDVANRLNGQRLDQHTAPLAAVPLNGQRITGLADPTSAQDGATKNYVDVAIVGINWKQSARVAASSNVTAGAASLTIDGVTLVNGNRVLLMGQTIGSQNGVYVVGGVGSAVTLTRSTDMDVGTEALSAAVPVEEGTVNADKVFLQITNAPITIGTTSLAFTQLSGGGATYTAGTGITISGNAIALTTPIDAPQMTGAGRITNTSSSHGLQILQQTTGDSSSEALDIVSDNEQDTTLGIRGVEAGRGTIKATHDKPPSGASDVNASVLSLRTNGSGTAAQLIFSDSDFGSTGKLFNLRQAGVDKFVVDANGTFVTAAMPATLVTNTPSGTIAATTAQAAINELEAEKAQSFTPTAVKTTAYTAAAADYVPVDATSAGVTVTLPTAPADRTRVGVKKIDTSANAVTIARGGSTDVFNKAAGSTSLSLSKANQSVMLHYSSSAGIWYVVAGDLPLSTLTKTDVGLANVDNTSDVNKPVSTAQQTALDGKLTGTGVTSVVKLTRPTYRALATPDANTEYVIVTQAQDDFQRTATDSWGTADSGQAWTLSSPASNFDIAVAGQATSTHTAAATDNVAALSGFSALEQEHELWWSLAALPVTSSAVMNAGLRWASTAQGFRGRVVITPAGVVQLTLQYTIASATNDYSPANVTISGLTYTAGMVLGTRIVVTGSSPTRLMGRVWDASKVEPLTWNVDITPTITTESALQSASGAAIDTRSSGGATAPFPVFTFYKHRVI